MHKMKKTVLLLLAGICGLLAGASGTVTPVEFAEYLTETEKLYTFPTGGWKFLRADKPEFAGPDFDDSKWTTVEVNRSLTSQPAAKKLLAGRSPYGWYRREFTLGEADASGNSVLMPGQISAGDEIFINGIFCGTYGFKKAVNNSSNRFRAYFIDGSKKILKPGRNVIAVRVKIGFLGGMHHGIPQLKKIGNSAILGRMKHHSRGKTAVFRQITGIPEINRFQIGERIFISPEMAAVTGKGKVCGMIHIQIQDSHGKILEQMEQKCTLAANRWIQSVPMEVKNPGRGTYTVRVDFNGEDQSSWETEYKFTVEKRKPFILPQEKLKTSELPLTVDSQSYGTFGPRILNRENLLVDDWSVQDSRGTPEFLVGFNRKYPGPMLMMSNLRPMPVPLKPGIFSHSIGTQHEHFENMWTLGTIQADGKNTPRISTLVTHWTGKTVLWTLPSSGNFSITLSQLSPAVTVRSNGIQTLEFFRQDPAFKLGAPSKIYIPRGNRLTEWKPGAELQENWLLVSWEGAANWQEFNIPVLMVMEKKPSVVNLTPQSLKITFAGQNSGAVRLMPLYGMRLLPPAGLPADALERCRRWSRILPGLPDRVTRTADVDYPADCLFFRDHFVWKTVRDDWNTPVEKYAPVPPIIMLAQRGGMNLSTDGNVEDLNLSTMYGPFCAVKNNEQITYAMKGYSHLVRQVRKITGLPDNPAVRKHRAKLTAAVKALLENAISTHPWKRLVYHPKSKVTFGYLQPDFSNLMLALEYMPADLAAKVKKELLTEVKNSVLKDDLVVRDAKGKTRTHNVRIKSSLSGVEFTAITRHARDDGIDCPCWEALRLYVYYDAARNCNAPELLRDNWTQIQRSYNLILNSHDWANCISWDSYAGIRVGNGFQENTIFHGALIAYARMAHSLGMETDSRQAAYYALMQLIGTKCCASSTSNDYFRAERTVLAAHSQYDDMEYLERKFPDHHLEFNERKGFCLWIMSPRSAFFSAGYIMTCLPEIMRPFREVWGDFANRHLNYRQEDGRTISHTLPPQVDHFQYLTHTPPFSVEELSQLREQRRAKRRSPAEQERVWWETIGDERAALDSYGKLEYFNLW